MFLRLINCSMTTLAFLPPKKKSTVILFFWVNRVIYHHVTIITLGISNFSSPKKKHKKTRTLSSPAHCSPNCWTWNGHEVQQKSCCMLAWISPKSLPAIRIHKNKKGDQGWGKSSQKKCRMGNVETEEKFWELPTSSSKIVRVLCSGLSCWTTEPRNKTGLTFHWIRVVW